MSHAAIVPNKIRLLMLKVEELTKAIKTAISYLDGNSEDRAAWAWKAREVLEEAVKTRSEEDWVAQKLEDPEFREGVERLRSDSGK